MSDSLRDRAEELNEKRQDYNINSGDDAFGCDEVLIKLITEALYDIQRETRDESEVENKRMAEAILSWQQENELLRKAIKDISIIITNLKEKVG